VAAGSNDFGQCDVADWRGIVAVAAGSTHTLGLRADGTVVAAGNNEHGQCDIAGWDEIQSPD
jgi:alpha-tubulin suppressor-like RCC1 family protein